MRNDILLVDDEQGIRTVLGISLEDRGYRVCTAGDGHEALVRFDQMHPPIVLTDIKMPGMDGIDLLRAIKQRSPDTEVIMITGHGDVDLAIRSLKFDATDFITKPIEEEILDVALKRAVERIEMREKLRHYTENLESLVEEKSRRLVQAERLAAMGETVAGLAHAIKNIAGGLRGGAFVVEQGLSLDNAHYLHQGWQMVKGNVARIQQLSLDLLNIAKPGLPAFRQVDPNQPLRDVHQLIQPQAGQYGIELVLSVAPDAAPVAMDPEGIHRCLLNLVTNAVDACTQSASVISSPKIEMACTMVAGGIEYHVSDNCGGMSESTRKRLFQGFFTTKGSRGTGIGLMLVRKIIEAHHGRIEVESEPGCGSRFVIRLPSGPCPSPS
jgi:signal transduction histidine kinase